MRSLSFGFIPFKRGQKRRAPKIVATKYIVDSEYAGNDIGTFPQPFSFVSSSSSRLMAFFFPSQLLLFVSFAEIRSYNMRKLQDYDTGIGESTTTISPLGSPQPCRSSTSSSSSSTASASTPIAAKPSSYFANYLQVKLIGLHLFIWISVKILFSPLFCCCFVFAHLPFYLLKFLFALVFFATLIVVAKIKISIVWSLPTTVTLN